MSLIDAWFVDPRVLIEKLRNGPGAERLGLAQKATNAEATEQFRRAATIELMVTKISDGWQGAAGTNAASMAAPLQELAGEDAQRLFGAQDLLDRQTGSFSRAVNDLRPMTDAPPTMSMDEAAPWENDHDQAVRTYQDDLQHNIDVYRRYDGASGYNETNMPSEYKAGRPSENSVSVKPPHATIDVDDSGPGNGGPGGDSSGPGNYSGFSSEPYPGGNGPVSGPPGGYPGEPGGRTTPNDWVAPSADSPYPPGVVPPAPVGREPVGQGPGGFVPGGQTGGPGGTGYDGGRTPGGPGGSGSGWPGAGGRTAGPGRPGAGARTFGPGPAVGAGALAAEEAAARRAAAAASARGGTSPMAAPMGAGRGKDDEDDEHKRKVLMESDSEDTFGSDELTAPQVIGDDEYED